MSILKEIVRVKRERVRELGRTQTWRILEASPRYGTPRRSLSESLRRQDEIRFLTEIKRASPSAGPIALDADAVRCAQSYREAGSRGLSLVTEEAYFRGRPDDLPGVAEVGLPVLMKDFFVDPWQMAQARSLGADAVLLIVALDDRVLLSELRQAARELSLEVLVEVHDERECDRAEALAPELVGVNNRNLATFEVDLATSERLKPFLPAATSLSESGIRSRADVTRLAAAGFDALLVGEHLMRSADPGDALRALRGVRA